MESDSRPAVLSVSMVRCLGALLVIQAGIFLFLTGQKVPEADEMETLYAAWAIATGQVPYRDFYQIHTPLSYYFFSPLFLFLNNLSVLYAARLLSFMVVIANGAVLFQIGRRLFTDRIALFCVFCYATSWPVLATMGEAKPDGLVVLFSNAALWALLALRGSRSFFLAGALVGLALLAKQSAVFSLAGILLCFWCCGRWGILGQRPLRVADVFIFMGGLAAIGAAFGAVVAANGAWAPFVSNAIANDFGRFALGIPVSLKSRSLMYYLMEFWEASGPQLVAAAIAVGLMGTRSGAGGDPGRRPLLLVGVWLAAAWMGVCVFVWHPWPQEFLLPAQPLALLAGYGGSWLVGRATQRIRGTPRSFFYAAFVVFFIGSFSVVPLVAFTSHYRDRPDRAFPIVKALLAATKPGEGCLSLVYACPFRPSVYYYRGGPDFEDSPLLLEKARRCWTQALVSGRVKAAAPLPDGIASLAPELRRLMDERFVPFEDSVYVRRQ